MYRIFALTVAVTLLAGATAASAHYRYPAPGYAERDFYTAYDSYPSYQCMEELSYSKGLQPCY